MASELVMLILGALVAKTLPIWKWLQRPRLQFEVRYGLLQERERTEPFSEDEEIYGFALRNTGKRVATGVRVQLTKIETRSGDAEFSCISGHASDLGFGGANAPSRPENTVTVLAPQATAVVKLGLWREPYGVIMPAVLTPERFEELVVDEMQFTIVAVADEADAVSEVIRFLRRRRHGGWRLDTDAGP